MQRRHGLADHVVRSHEPIARVGFEKLANFRAGVRAGLGSGRNRRHTDFQIQRFEFDFAEQQVFEPIPAIFEVAGL
jgi:hypothetical protein